MSPLRTTLGVIALLMAVLPAGASARRADSIFHNKRLWATVNVCDTVGHPDSIGIRGSMPGSGDKAELMFMRFQVQVFDPELTPLQQQVLELLHVPATVYTSKTPPDAT